MAKYHLAALPAERTHDYAIISLEPNQITYMVKAPARRNPTSDVQINLTCGLLAAISWTINSDARRYVDYDRLKSLVRRLIADESAATITPYSRARVCVPRPFSDTLVVNGNMDKVPKSRLRGYWVLQYNDDIYLVRFNDEGLIVRFQLAEQVVDKQAPDTPIPVAEPPRRKRGRPRKNP
jgi:hypothetical protein